MGGDLIRAGQASVNYGLGGTPYEPKWHSKGAKNLPQNPDVETFQKYLLKVALENLENGALAIGAMGAMKVSGKVLGKVWRGTAAENATTKGVELLQRA